ncbi:hypothetical protein BG262_03680 [Floricoccus penangensis]|uniref:MgtC/SapB/SrpB/YhiD N-terminal domain-containing protein n=1 Tax=Floricoccus penangensis TaxID=1859475 RepID=A0A9Q5JGX1_9LACT|nr:MgtC/SapB family protein [Floricoccus penangensis]OFI46900.1 hypothetical protein BG262_03680 [Floricoccus penangensis]
MLGSISIYEIIFRVVLSILCGILISIEHQRKNGPTGMRTHIHALVCLGAAIIALTQFTIAQNEASVVRNIPSMASAISIDESKLIAQIVSGIGFLGAGAIIVTRKQILGLTTAASIWISGGVGMAVGMGFYSISIIGTLAVITTQFLIHKFLNINMIQLIEIRYIDREDSGEFISDFFKSKNIYIQLVNFEILFEPNCDVCREIYRISMPKGIDDTKVLKELSKYQNIIKIGIVDV